LVTLLREVFFKNFIRELALCRFLQFFKPEPGLNPGRLQMRSLIVLLIGITSLMLVMVSCEPEANGSQTHSPETADEVPGVEEKEEPAPLIVTPQGEAPQVEPSATANLERPKVKTIKVSYEISDQPHWTELLRLMGSHGVVPVPKSAQKLTKSFVEGEVAKVPLVPETLTKFTVEAEKIAQTLAAKAENTRGALENIGLQKDAPTPDGYRSGAVPDTLLQQLFMRLMNEQEETGSPIVQAAMRLIQEWNETQSPAGAPKVTKEKVTKEVEVPLIDVDAYKLQLNKYIQTEPKIAPKRGR
jgi:hypothetical protein